MWGYVCVWRWNRFLWRRLFEIIDFVRSRVGMQVMARITGLVDECLAITCRIRAVATGTCSWCKVSVAMAQFLVPFGFAIL